MALDKEDVTAIAELLLTKIGISELSHSKIKFFSGELLEQDETVQIYKEVQRLQNLKVKRLQKKYPQLSISKLNSINSIIEEVLYE